VLLSAGTKLVGYVGVAERRVSQPRELGVGARCSLPVLMNTVVRYDKLPYNPNASGTLMSLPRQSTPFQHRWGHQRKAKALCEDTGFTISWFTFAFSSPPCEVSWRTVSFPPPSTVRVLPLRDPCFASTLCVRRLRTKLINYFPKGKYLYYTVEHFWHLRDCTIAVMNLG